MIKITLLHSNCIAGWWEEQGECSAVTTNRTARWRSASQWCRAGVCVQGSSRLNRQPCKTPGVHGGRPLLALAVAAEVSTCLQQFMCTNPDSCKHFAPPMVHIMATIFSSIGSTRWEKMYVNSDIAMSCIFFFFNPPFAQVNSRKANSWPEHHSSGALHLKKKKGKKLKLKNATGSEGSIRPHWTNWDTQSQSVWRRAIAGPSLLQLVDLGYETQQIVNGFVFNSIIFYSYHLFLSYWWSLLRCDMQFPYVGVTKVYSILFAVQVWVWIL